MRLLTGTRIGQSGQELKAAVLFSFIIHFLFLFSALFLSTWMTPKIIVPPFYEVALVQDAVDIPEVPLQKAAPEPVIEKPKKTEPLRTKTRPAEPAVKKGEMPELGKRKPAIEEEKPVKPEEKAGTRAAGPPVSVSVANAPGFKFPPYLAIIREKIERHWNPPPGSKVSKAKVTFSITRSGRVSDPQLEVASGNFYFDQAAMRAILTASPFPPLPEGFFKEFAVFSVDLMEKE